MYVHVPGNTERAVFIVILSWKSPNRQVKNIRKFNRLKENHYKFRECYFILLKYESSQCTEIKTILYSKFEAIKLKMWWENISFFDVDLISRAILGKQVMQSIYGQMYLYIIIDNKK